MGTRATVTFYGQWKEADPRPVAMLYVQSDGYWDGVGKDVATILASRPLVNGMRDQNPCFNGAGNMAVQVVADLQNEHGSPGLYYLHDPDDEHQYHHYDVIGHYPDPATNDNVGRIEFVVTVGGKEQFRGTPAEFLTAEEPSDEEEND